MRNFNFDNLSICLEDLARRGPDFKNTKTIDDNIYLGFTRLALVNFDSGPNQPVENSSCNLLFNGEIYNWRELCEDYALTIYGRSPKNDAETILSGYLKVGLEIFNFLRGPFSIAILDQRVHESPEIVLVRDLHGEKPLFYTIISTPRRGVFFSSNSIQVLRQVELKNINLERTTSEFLQFGFLDLNLNPIGSMNQVPQGEVLKIQISTGSESIKKLTIRKDSYNKSLTLEDQVLLALRQSVEESIASCDFPIGLFLSSGVDSTLIAAVASELGYRIPSFTVTYSGMVNSEASIAAKTAVAFSTSHTSVECFYDRDLFVESTEQLDIPVADLSYYALFFLSREAKKEVKACLTGDGGDEMFGGYDTYAATILNNYIGGLAERIKSGTLLRLLDNPQGYERNFFRDVSRFLKYASQDSFDSHKSWRRVFDDEEIYALGFAPLETQNTKSNKRQMGLRAALLLDQKTWLSQNILVKSDRASMSNGLELRAPFLSPTIYEVASRVPENQLRRLFSGKKILKTILKDKYGIASGPKLGFISPIADWIIHDYKHFESIISASELFNPIAVHDLIQSHISRKRNNAHKIYCLYVYSTWYMRLGNALC